MSFRGIGFICERHLLKALHSSSKIADQQCPHGLRLYLTHSNLQRPVHQQFLCRGIQMLSFGQQNNVSKAVSHAEKIVGYPTSFLSLRCLLSDELSNVAMHIRKLVGTKHPLLKTARGLVFDGQHNLQMRGLLVMLISKAAGPSQGATFLDKDLVSGIHPSQRSLAEITEVIHTANLIHKGVVNLDNLAQEDGLLTDMEFGNKLAVLSGDFLLASACMGLAKLGNSLVVSKVASSIGDMMTAEFTQFTNADGHAIIPNDCHGFSDWLKQTFLAAGSLLAKSCQSAMILAGHSKDIQDMAFNFGQNVSYSYQLAKDLVPFLNKEEISQLSLTSGPFLMYKEQASAQEFAKIQEMWNAGSRDYSAIVSEMFDQGVISKCQDLCRLYRDNAISALQSLPPSDAKDALINMATVMSEVR